MFPEEIEYEELMNVFVIVRHKSLDFIDKENFFFWIIKEFSMLDIQLIHDLRVEVKNTHSQENGVALNNASTVYSFLQIY